MKDYVVDEKLPNPMMGDWREKPNKGINQLKISRTWWRNMERKLKDYRVVLILLKKKPSNFD